MVFDELEGALTLDTKGYSRGTDRAERATSDLDRAAVQLSTSAQRAAEGLDDIGAEAVQTAAEASAAESQTESLGDELTQTATSASLAASRLDRVGDEMSEQAAKATAASGATSAYAGSATTAALASGGLSTAMLGSLIPAFAALSSVAGPLVATFGALAAGAASLAGAFGAIVGTGVLAWGDKLASQNKQRLQQVNQQIRRLEALQDTEEGLTQAQRRQLESLKDSKSELEDTTTAAGALEQRFGELKNEIAAILIPFGQQFIPLIEDAVDALPRLVQRMVNAVGGTESFRNELRRLGGIAMDVIPDLTGAMFDFARTALPAFRDLVNVIRRRATPTFSYLGDVVNETAPEFDDLFSSVVDMLGPLTTLGVTVTNVVVPRLADLIDAVTDAIRWFNDLPKPIQQVSIAAAALTPIIVGTVTAVAGLVSAATAVAGALSAVVPALTGLVTPTVAAGAAIVGLGVNFDDLRNLAVTAVTRIADRVPALLRQMRTQSETILSQLRETFRTAMRTIRSGVAVAMVAVSNQIIDELERSNSRTSQSLQQMRTEYQQSFTAIREIVTRLLTAVLGAFREHIQSVGTLWKAHLQGSDGIVANARTAMNTLWQGIIKPTLDIIQGAWQLFGDDLIQITRASLDTVLVVARTALDALLTAINVTLDIISGDWEGAFRNIRDFFQRTWTRIAEWTQTSARTLLVSAFSIVVDGIKAIWNAFYQWAIGGSFFPDLFGDIAGYVVGAGRSAVVGAFSTVVGAIETTLNSIDLSGISNAINGIIDAAEDAISAIADIPDQKTTEITRVTNYETDVSPSTDFEPDDDDDDDGGGGGGDSSSSFSGGGGSFRNDAVSGGTTVGLARGGYVTGPTAAFVGEGDDDEFVTPHSTMERILRDVAREAMSAGGGSGGGNTNIVIEEGAIQAPGGDPDEIMDELQRRLERLYPNRS